MTIVTLTDHNSIDGVRELLDRGYSDVFVSAEMTTTFPEDGCNIHVTASRSAVRGSAPFAREHLRDDLYVDREIENGLAACGQSPAYFMTHLMSTQNRPYGREGSLAIEHIEALVLQPLRDPQRGADQGAESAHHDDAARLDRPTMNGSPTSTGSNRRENPLAEIGRGRPDDHSGNNPGHAWTNSPTPLRCPRATRRRLDPKGDTTSARGPHHLAHSVLKFLRQPEEGCPHSNRCPSRVLAYTVLRLVFDSKSERHRAASSLDQGLGAPGSFASIGCAHVKRAGAPFETVFDSEVCALLADPGLRSALSKLDTTAQTDERIFLVVGTLLNRIFARYVQNLRDAGNLGLVGLIKEVVALVTSNVFVSLPYFMSFLAQSSDCLIARDVRKSFGLAEPQRVVLVTDTLFEVNGVAATIRRMMREALRRDLDFTVVTCLADHELSSHTADPEIKALIEAGRLKIFPSVAQMAFPEYDRLQIRFPRFSTS
jgi:hypothetical protein